MNFAANSLDGLKSLLSNYQTKLIEYQTIVDNLTVHIQEMEKELQSKNFLADYDREFSDRNNTVFYIDDSNTISRCLVRDISYEELKTGNLHYYPTMEYAKKAQRMKKLNDKLLAFKWCYDRDYDVKQRTCSYSYVIHYDNDIHKYTWTSIVNSGHNIIYFSTKEIAQLCCDWLNTELEDYDET